MRLIWEDKYLVGWGLFEQNNEFFIKKQTQFYPVSFKLGYKFAKDNGYKHSYPTFKKNFRFKEMKNSNKRTSKNINEIEELKKNCITDPKVLGIKAKLCVDKNRSRWRSYTTIENETCLILTHRLIWRNNFGMIPKGLSIAHKCGNSTCINIDHLYLATHKENMQDKYLHGTAFKKLNGLGDLEGIIKKYNSGNYTQSALAKEYGIKRESIRDLIKKHKEVI